MRNNKKRPRLTILSFRKGQFLVYENTARPPIAGPYKTLGHARKAVERMEKGRDGL